MLSLLIALIILAFVGVTLRLLYITPLLHSAASRRQRFHATSPRLSSPSSPPSSPKIDANRKHHVLIVLGSGGHTTEMLDLLPSMDTSRIVHRSYVFSSGDAYSATLARNFEEQLAQKKKGKVVVDTDVAATTPVEENKVLDEGNGKEEFVLVDKEDEPNTATQPSEATSAPRPSPKLPKTTPNEKPSYDLLEIPRARKVGQSWLSTPYTCLLCLLTCLSIVRGGPSKGFDGRLGWPSLIICNGPGTAVMVALASYVFRFFGLVRTKIIYIESFTRVKELSLSGKLLLPFADRFLVQWPELAQKYSGVELLELVDGVKPGQKAVAS